MGEDRGSNGDRTGGERRRYTVPEAAEALGSSSEAVWTRISRKTLNTVRDRGQVFVLLDPDQTGALVDSLQDQVQFLRGQLDAERQAHAEARRIIAALTQRIPELEAPREMPGEPKRAGGDASRGGVPPDRESAPQRPWWRRIFGE